MKKGFLAVLAALILSSGAAYADSGLMSSAAKVGCAIDYQASVIASLTDKVPRLSYLDEYAETIINDKRQLEEIAEGGNREVFNQYLKNTLYPNMLLANAAVKGIGSISVTKNVRERLLEEFRAQKEDYLSCLASSETAPAVASSGGASTTPISTSPPQYVPEKRAEAAGVAFRNVEMDILKYTNAERAKNGLNQLKLDDLLSKIALEHSVDMGANNYFNHKNLNGEGPTERALRNGYDVHKVLPNGWSTHGIGENLAKMPTGQVTGIGYVAQDSDSIAKATVAMWMRSEGHRANLMNKNYDTIGIGVSYTSPYFIITQNFK